ncbi:SURF1 family protein [Altererythrobacter sp. GH1-8]|uniref:SURF1 family protein n=1 Tax=Altererythrobacter sp. GH1-8 TaxID=3349333 RepID=UPI00374D59E2
MNLRQLPVIPTIVVVVAVAIMVALGIWQLGRSEEKAELIARYEAASELEPVPFPWSWESEYTQQQIRDQGLFRRSAFECTEVLSREAIAGRSENGRSGFAQIVRCMTGRGPADVKLGWSNRPDFPDYDGGVVVGIITPGGADGGRLQADPPLAGLQPLAKPDPSDLPNNHLAYAGQWFFFALTALVIYWFAIQSRLKARKEEEG